MTQDLDLIVHNKVGLMSQNAEADLQAEGP
jgi:hypothetical protein